MNDDVDISYRSRAKLQEIAADSEEHEMVNLAAKVATRLSIPMLEALRREWVRGPLFNQSDSSIYDRIVAAIEYDGHDNFHMNNRAIALINAYGLDKFNDVSDGEKSRFARAVVRSALVGAFGPQRFLRDSDRIANAWLRYIVDETANQLMEHRDYFWSKLMVRAAFNPLRVWVRRTANLPDRWVLLLEASIQRMVPYQWYRVYSADDKAAMLQIWQAINDNVDRDRIWALKNPDLVTEFIDLLQVDG